MLLNAAATFKLFDGQQHREHLLFICRNRQMLTDMTSYMQTYQWQLRASLVEQENGALRTSLEPWSATRGPGAWASCTISWLFQLLFRKLCLITQHVLYRQNLGFSIGPASDVLWSGCNASHFDSFSVGEVSGHLLMLLSSVFPRTGLSVDSVTCSLNSILCSG